MSNNAESPTASGAAHGWAALRKHIERELRKARRAKRMALKGGAKYHDAAEYWEGNIVALANLRKEFAREMKAPPNRR